MDIFLTLFSLVVGLFIDVDVYQDTVATIESGTSTAIVIQVIDGDTIDVQLDETNAVQRVRYIGVDTPEPYRDGEAACYAEAASLYNESLVAGQMVTLVSDKEDSDRYGRILRYVYVGDAMVNATLLREGYATTLTIPPNTRYEQRFTALEEVARTAQRGLWGNCR